MSATFSIRQHTEAVAEALAIEWCTKLQYLFDVWEDAGRSEVFDFSDDALRGYREGEEFTRLVVDAPHATTQRVEQIWSLKPKRVIA